MKKLLSTCVLGLLLAVSAQAQGGLVITEISYNPPESGADSLEFIEIYNSSAAAIDLQGYYISFGGVTIRDSFASSFVLPAGGIVVTAVNDTAVFQQFGMSSVPRQWRSGGALSNTSTAIRLFDNTGTLIDSVAYFNSWVTGTNGAGASMILCDVNSDNSLSASWSISRRNTGNAIGSVVPLPLFGSPGILEVCPPINDNCPTAIPLTMGTSCSPTSGTTLNATESQAGCTGDADDDVWYQFVATTTSAVVDVQGGTDFDAVLEVFSGACGTLTSLQCIDDDGSGAPETVTLTGLTVGSTYRLRVYDYYDATSPPTDPTFTVCVYEAPNPPANDDCAGAITLTPAATCSPISGSTASATQSLAGCAGNADDDVWYSFTATSVENDIAITGGLSFDGVIEVFSGACGALTSISCEDDFGTGTPELLAFDSAVIGQTYFVRVYHYGTGSSTTPTFGICVQTSSSADCSTFAVSLSAVNGNCAGQAGSITATVANGTAPIGYLWNDFSTTAVRTGLDAGTYSITVADANFCTATASSTLVGGAGFTAFSASATDASAAAAADGAITTTATGGLAPFAYNWSNGATTANLTALVPATYSVTISDANGCTSVQSATVGFPSAIADLQDGARYTLYPNPAQTAANLDLFLVESAEIRIELYSLTGQLLYTTTQMQAAGTQVYALPVAELASGVYVVRLTADSGNTQSIRLTISK